VIAIDPTLSPKNLLPGIDRLFELSGAKILALQEEWDESKGTPVFTVRGRYTSRGWTEWTRGFQFGSALLQFDATGEQAFLRLGRAATLTRMSGHLTHTGVHDHGFNNVSTYGNLLRLMDEGRIPEEPWERAFYELALKVSGAVQAARWTELPEGFGYIFSFNGPHSLFVDTLRSLRALGLAHQLGQVLMGEQDARISLLERLLKHALTTARFNLYWGEGRDAYDVRGRTVHEAVFNTRNGSFRCPSSQQGYSPFSTWTRGLAWAICGCGELAEFLDFLPAAAFQGISAGGLSGRQAFLARCLEAGEAVSDFYLENTPADGIPYWDTGAPGLSRLGNYLEKPADPFNEHEPVDSSAAAIAAQGLLRLGRLLSTRGCKEKGDRFFQAGLTVAGTLFAAPYLCEDPGHQGLLLHSVYHRPNGWDYVPAGRSVPCGESSMWGDYHARELGVYLKRLAQEGPYHVFYLKERTKELAR